MSRIVQSHYTKRDILGAVNALTANSYFVFDGSATLAAGADVPSNLPLQQRQADA